VIGELTRSRTRAYEASGEIRLHDDTVLVKASGVYVRIPDEVVEEAKSALDFWQVVPD